MKTIRKSYNGLCADFTDCFPTWQKKEYKKRWLQGRILFRGITNEGNIVVTPVCFATDHKKTQFMMDGITGTLYRTDGSCCTSDHLRLLEVIQKDNLDKELMATKNTKAIGG
jgi:hypothetical protein